MASPTNYWTLARMEVRVWCNGGAEWRFGFSVMPVGAEQRFGLNVKVFVFEIIFRLVFFTMNPGMRRIL